MSDSDRRCNVFEKLRVFHIPQHGFNAEEFKELLITKGRNPLYRKED